MISFKEYVNVVDKTSILEEGGLAGHMSHLYDNRDLTFGSLKHILTEASQGKLIGTEKADGQNIMISYSIKEGKAKAARNKSNIKQGGMDADQLATKFEGRKEIKDVFVEAFKVFEKAVQSLSPKQQLEIFGPDADIYYNAEIIDPRTANVLIYDKKTLLIHQVGHAFFDKQTGNVVDVDIEKNKEALEKALTIMQDSIQGEQYQIIKNAVKQLQGLSDDRALRTALEQIIQLQQRFNLNDNNTIGNFISVQIYDYIQSELQKHNIILTEDQIDMLISRALGQKGLNIVQITKDMPKEVKEIVKNISNNSIKLIKSFIFPLEEIIHEFSIEMLKNLRSAFIINPQKEIRRIQTELNKTINLVQNSGSEEAHEILKRQLQKLKSVERVTSAIEGFVFDYDGHTYKFTGNFAPINVLLGLFKYKRI